MTNHRPTPGFEIREQTFFDELVNRTGDTWWGNTSQAGRCRLDRRARLISEMIHANAAVLELGCGTGPLTSRLLQLRADISLVACDISGAALAAAKVQCAPFNNVHLIQGNILELSFPNRFDYVVGNGILHHLPLENALEAIDGFLRPSGGIAFFEPNLLNPHVAIEKNVRFVGRHLGNTEDERAFSRFQLAALLAKRFSRVSISPFDFVHPKTPPTFIPFMMRLGFLLEEIPIVREVAGSMRISARRTLPSV